VVDVGGGTFTVVSAHGKRYIYVYYQDSASREGECPVSVARAPVGAVMAAAARGRGVGWYKYYKGKWTQPGEGGRSSALLSDRAHCPYWMGVSFNSFVRRYLMAAVTSKRFGDRLSTQLRIAQSRDGVHWSPLKLIQSGTDELEYPTIVGVGADPLVSGQQFSIYYIRSTLGGERSPEDAALVRRSVNFAR
jgi:hypothetical protein